MLNIAVIGMGNVLMGDDGFGPYVIEVLKSRYEFQPSTSVIDVGTPGLDLSPYLGNVDAAIVVDTVLSDAPPGTLRTYDKALLLRGKKQIRLSPHEPGLQDCLTLLEIAGQAPEQVALVGVVPESSALEAKLTPAVKRGVETTIDEVIRQLTEWAAPPKLRAIPAEPDLWWEAQPA